MDTDTSARLQLLLGRLIPIVDGLADKLQVLLFVLAGLLLWFGFYLLGIRDWSWQTTVTLLMLVVVPLLILGRLYWSLRDLQALPDTMDEVSGDLRAGWTQLSSGKRSAFNIFSQARQLFEMRGLLGSADELIGNYVSFGILINPLFLILSVLALLFTLFLLLVGLGTLLGAIFRKAQGPSPTG